MLFVLLGSFIIAAFQSDKHHSLRLELFCIGQKQFFPDNVVYREVRRPKVDSFFWPFGLV